jgi:hypoxanthine phosphoribosyltransferase
MLQLSWDHFHRDCELLAASIRASGRAYDKLLCVTRGGVFVGGLLGHMLNIRNITTIALKLYDFDQQGHVVEQLSAPDLPLPGSRILVVDDMLDSGRTLSFIIDKWRDEYSLDIAVLYDKGHGDLRPAFTARAIPDEWVAFPWEPPLPATAPDAVTE